MNIHSFVLALVLGAPLLQSPALAFAASDPRTPINAVETPGDADSVFRIDQPGSYYLEANLDGVAGKSGIEIASPDVTIDLMGFVLQGAVGSGSAIHVTTGSDIEIVNGRIKNWGAFGVHGPLAQRTRVRDLQIFNCAGGGIGLDGHAYVERCWILISTGPGITVGSLSTVSGCTVQSAQIGISVGAISMVDACHVASIADRGILVGAQSTVRGSTARFCGTAAIFLASDSIVINSAASLSVDGIHGLGSLRVIDSTSNDNSSHGLRLGSGVVRGCSITRNQQHGIEITDGAHVVGNFITSNGQDGIRSLNGSRIEDNEIRGHLSGAGIRTFGTGSYIVKNTLTKNGSTIVAPNSGNFVGTLVSTNGINGRNDPWANLYSN